MTNSIHPVDGKKIAFLGNLSHKKGVELMVHSFNAIHKFDSEFQFFIGGNIQDPRYAIFLDYAIPRLGLQDVVHYHGHIDDVISWFADKDFLLISSPLEGCPVGALEGLSCGLTPLFYDFVGAKDLYPPEFIWKDFEELIQMIQRGPGKPKKYQNFVKNNYSLDKQLKKITTIVENLIEKGPKTHKIHPKSTTMCVLAVKNGQKTISKAIQSLLNQTKPLDKIIVVNDGSTDDTENIVRKFLDSSKVPIEIITNPKSKWVFFSRNQGAQTIKSDFFFFLDSDDFVEPTYIEKTSEILDKDSSVAVVYSDMVYFDESGTETVYNLPEYDPQILMQRNHVAYSSMQRTSIFKELGGYSDYMNDCRNHLTEWDLWLRYIKAGKTFKRLAEPLFHYFKSGDDQMSANYSRPRNDMHLQLVVGLTDGGKGIEMTGEKKRILWVSQGKDYCDRNKVGFELMTIVKPLEEFGDVFTFQYDVEMKYYGRDGMLRRLQTFVDLVKPTYIFHFSYKDDIPVEVWNNISNVYNTIVFHSDEWRYNEFCKEYEKGFKFAITTYPSVFEQMDHPGKILSQWAANTHYFHPREKDIEISFTGQANQNRIELLNGLDVECYGLGWNNGFVDFTEMASVLGRSKISLSFSMGVKGRQLKLRPFEITASKALCICESMPGIENYFVPEKEIILFDNKKEMDEAIACFITHPNKAEVIAQAGYERTMKEHLWSHRLKEVFDIVNQKSS